MEKLLKKIPQFLFFTGKGGVGKTSMACVLSIALAKHAKKVLLISTDPASNLDEVLQTPLASVPTMIQGVANLEAMNINPVVAALEYREKMVAPYRGVLPQAAVEQIEEQLSGACTVEIAGFNEFSKYVGDEDISKKYDHIILDTAPTGHTLRLLKLPSAWNSFIDSNSTGSSCLGAVSGLSENKKLYESVVENLQDGSKTLLAMVTRAEKLSLLEASRASSELAKQGIKNQHLIINGVFESLDDDGIAQDFSRACKDAIESMADNLKAFDHTKVGFYPNGLIGIEALGAPVEKIAPKIADNIKEELSQSLAKLQERFYPYENLLRDIEKDKNGLVMTMGKGGVGKTSIASNIALDLAKRGHKVVLSTTDPAAHLNDMLQEDVANLTIERINPKEVTQAHIQRVIKENEGKISDDDMALLKEELSTPCIEEIAVFEAFADTVAKAQESFVILDTAPTGHTLLLLDASRAYHKEVLKNAQGGQSEALEFLLPRLKDKKYTKVLLIALAEATPTHEAQELQNDLRRASIEPFAWVINKSFALSQTRNPLLLQKAVYETKYIEEITHLAQKVIVKKWSYEA